MGWKLYRSAIVAPLPLLLLPLLTVALPRASEARILNVPSSYPTLQAAAAAAAYGDTVLFAPGTYTGGIWLPDKAIVAASRFITTGDTAYISQTVLSGLVSNICGGASGCTGDAIFEYGTHADGGAIIGLTLTNAVKGLRTSSRTDMDWCHAINMTGAGDGVNYLPRSSGRISNSLFMGNRDDGIDLNGEVEIQCVNNTIRDNWDDGIEFRMYPWSGPLLTVTITGNRFINNGSDGIQLIDSPDSSHREVVIDRNLFHGNQKAVVGCMGNQQTMEDYSGTPLGEHVIFANNTCVNNFYGVCGGANSVVVNNIFQGTTNSAVRRVGGYSITAHNQFYANGLNYETSNMDLPHTYIGDPRLDANDRLTAGSPAINAGVAFYQWRGQTIVNLQPSSYSGSAPDLGAFEFGSATNSPPVVNAGPDQTIVLPSDAILDGTESDDGLPNPPAAVTTTWSRAGGPGTVTFLNPTAIDTRATFSAAGTYLLRLAATDGAFTVSDTMQVIVQSAATGTIFERRVVTGSDDAEESSTGTVTISSSDLELMMDTSLQTVGIRFTNVALPRNAIINRAWIQFEAAGAQSEATNLTFRAEAADNPAGYTTTGKISTRARTAASAAWSPVSWSAVGEAGANQRTTDLTAPVQEIVNRTGWTSGNAMAFIVTGTGHRTAWSFEGKAAGAPLLHVEYGTTTPPPPTNVAPVVDAGPTRTVTLPSDVALDGTVSDDGLPNPPGAFTVTWSKGSGPGTVTFQDASAVDTRAAFSVAGTYWLRLTAGDGALSASDSVQVAVQPATTTSVTVDRRVSAGSDDVEETPGGSLQIGSTDIELVFDISDNQWIGLRFTNVTVPHGATITRAYLQFEADEVQSEATSLRIQAQAADNPVTFDFSNKVQTRPRTTAFATWAPVPWASVGEAGPNQRSVDLSPVIQEVVNRPGWTSGNAMAIVISGTGHRTARAFESVPLGAALLHLEASTGGPPPPPNTAPVVEAGIEQIVTLPADLAPADVILDGTVGDDGLPNPPGTVTTTWSRASGPGPVTFQNAGAVDTRAGFTVAGTYLLRLTANDGAMAAADTVLITVQPTPVNHAPVVEAGADQTIVLPGSATLSGTLTDDGLPDPPGSTTSIWSVASGPGTVTFQNVNGLTTGVGFSAPGTYRLRLTADDGELSAMDSLLITVQAGTQTNAPPVADAGPAQTITLPADAILAGSASDDGLPNPPAQLTTAWSLVSGPAGVAFQDPAALDTRVSFTAAGSYWLRLTATDGALGASDSVLITVQPDPSGNSPPIVSAGPDETITLPADAVLDGSASDDGLPSGHTLTVAWSLVSGPAPVAFQDPAAVYTIASFTTAGTYHLRLAADDGGSIVADTMQVLVQPAVPVNAAPVVSAGSGQTIQLPADAALDGTVSDDGLPNPPGALTTTWSVVSGPGGVSFQDANAVDTRAAFTASGTYILRLTANDGALSASATVQIFVQPPPVITTVDRRIATGSDDAEESATGTMQLGSTDIELVFDISDNQWVGLRFTNMNIAPGSTITKAYVQFEADEVQSEATNLTIRAQAADNPITFSFTDKVSIRPRTTSSASWAPVPWTLVGEAGANQRTVDLSPVIQEVVNRPGWASGNAMVIVINGTGHRTARSFEGLPAGAALLHIEAASSPPPPPPNTAPVVNAGADQTITLPADAVLDGTVSDDGFPSPPGALSTAWSKVSGPGTVTFLNASAVDTRASFSVAGTYVLGLIASDGALSTSSTVTITVLPAPPATTLERRVATSSDDTEESATGTVFLNSSDLELVNDGGNQWVGIRFAGLSLPRAATITRAYVQFEAAGVQSEATSLTIRAQAADNPATFTTTTRVSTLPRTTASATWSPVPWSVVGEANANQRTTDLTPVIQEVVNRTGWASGNALVVIVNGTGHRTAQSYEGKAAGAPLLHVEYVGGPPPPTNAAPVVDAGIEQIITLPADALLDGTVSDDGLPNPPAAVTTTWSRVSGPGTVTFQSASAVDTRATFSLAGTYLLRLTASDGALVTTDSVVVNVQPASPTNTTIDRRVAASSDDTEESATGTVLLNSSDLELVNDGSNQTVGIRFTGITLPRGAVITRAYIQFEAAGVHSEATNLTIRAQAIDNSATFTTSTRPSTFAKTTAAATWAPVPWSVLNEAGANQRTPELSAVVQEIVNRTGWASGNAMTIIITGTGHRTAWSYEGKQTSAPLLHIEATLPSQQQAPQARAFVAEAEAPRYEFALHRLSPNPSTGPLRVEFSLASSQPASLDVLDVMGRRVASRDVGSLGPGRHVFEVREALRPGFYIVRLAQGGRSGVLRAVVVR